MANKGLKRYTKNYEVGFRNGIMTYSNICSVDSNVIIEIPLIKTFMLNPIKLNLYFNYQERNELGFFG